MTIRIGGDWQNVYNVKQIIMAGKTINELDARTMPNGKENIPFQEGNTNGRLSTDALKRYVAPDLTAYQKTVDADKKYLSAVEIEDVTSIL